MNVRRRYEEIAARIAAAARRSGRSPAEVRVVAVSKSFPPDAVTAAAACGITDFGENRAQEFRAKQALIGDLVRWHFVGHLQTNKVRYVVGHAVLVHSVDRPEIADAIARRARARGTIQDVLLEINVSGEPTKHGVDPLDAAALARHVAGLEGVAVKGLMSIAPLTPDPESARVYFKELAALRVRLARRLPDVVELSMGMSGDFEVAVEEGATIVRIGEAIFGPRPARRGESL